MDPGGDAGDASHKSFFVSFTFIIVIISSLSLCIRCFVEKGEERLCLLLRFDWCVQQLKYYVNDVIMREENVLARNWTQSECGE